jgi:uncharacterized protein YkwD
LRRKSIHPNNTLSHITNYLLTITYQHKTLHQERQNRQQLRGPIIAHIEPMEHNTSGVLLLTAVVAVVCLTDCTPAMIEVLPDRNTRTLPGSNKEPATAPRTTLGEPAFIPEGGAGDEDKTDGKADPTAGTGLPSECATLGLAGECNGAIARWCQGALVEMDCSAQGQECGWLNESERFRCVDTAEELPLEGCGDLDFLGECDGDLARWCDSGQVRERDCAALGMTCQRVDDSVGFYCTANPPDETVLPGEMSSAADPCEGLDFLGTCDGDIARWCDGGQVRVRDCSQEGKVCDYVDDSVGYYCTTGDSPAPVDPPPPVEPPAEGPFCNHEIVREVLRLANESRQEQGAAPLECDEALSLAAYLHSLDMCEQDYFSHDSADGRTLGDRLWEQQVDYRTAGENIAWGQQSAGEVHDDWMNSPGHRANLLNGQFSRLGVGYVPCDGQPHWTQNFAD